MGVTLREAFEHRRFPVALEITPPKTPLPRVLERRARTIEPYATAINVIQRPGRQSSLEASIALHTRAVEPVWHLTVRGRTREEVLAEIATARVHGIRHVLCILGDSSTSSDRPDQLKVRDAVELVREGLPGALVGATFNQNAPDTGAALKNLLPKLRAGAMYVQTQPVFDIAGFESVGRTVLAAAPGAYLVPMAMPLLSIEAAKRIEVRLGFALPAELKARIAEGPESAWAVFEGIIQALVHSDVASGVAIMTFETDPGPAQSARLVDSLRRAGVRPRLA